jgi:hypothetical protein
MGLARPETDESVLTDNGFTVQNGILKLRQSNIG